MGSALSDAEVRAKVEAIDHLALEVGAIFDREKLDPDVASAVLLDLAARVYAKHPSAEVRSELVSAGKDLLGQLTEHYAAGGR